MQIVRWIVFIIGLFFLFLGMMFLLGTPKMPTFWINGYLMGVLLTTYAIPTLWISVTKTYRVLAGGGLAALITFGGVSIYLLRLSLQMTGILELGEYCLSFAVLSLWFLFLGWKLPKRKSLRLPFTTQLLFALILTTLIMKGIFLVIPLPGFFPWLLTPQLSVIYGWFLIGSCFFIAWSLFSPIWENAYPLLYAILVYDALMIGPYLSLLREPSEVAVIPFQLWLAIVFVVASGIWALLELIGRFFAVRRSYLG